MSGLSDGDRQWLELKFAALHGEIKESGSRVSKLKTQMLLLEAGSPHKCAEEILKHEVGAWSHNPKKALGLLATIVTVWEGVRSFLHR